jgi:phosphoribosylanthranilate isomerase
MCDPDNINALQQLDFDFMGLIRYPKSKRFVSDAKVKTLENTTFNKGNVGVYVNESFESIIKDIIPLQLDVIQLHGDEDTAFAKALLELDLKIFKAFQIDQNFDFETLEKWVDLASQFPSKLFFLFDTATPNYGGSGKQFDWNLLKKYTAAVPFMLSGGIGADHVEDIKNLKHDMFMGVDLNSKFESAPGIKNIDEIETFIKAFRK